MTGVGCCGSSDWLSAWSFWIECAWFRSAVDLSVFVGPAVVIESRALIGLAGLAVPCLDAWVGFWVWVCLGTLVLLNAGVKPRLVWAYRG